MRRDYVIGTERVWLGRVAVLGGKTYRPRAVRSRHACTYLHLGTSVLDTEDLFTRNDPASLWLCCSSGREALRSPVLIPNKEIRPQSGELHCTDSAPAPRPPSSPPR